MNQPEEKMKELEHPLDALKEMIEAARKGESVGGPYYECIVRLDDNELEEIRRYADQYKGRSKVARENLGVIKDAIESTREERYNAQHPVEAEQRAYETSLHNFKVVNAGLMADFDWDSYIANHQRMKDDCESRGLAGSAAVQSGVLRAAVEVRDEVRRAKEQGQDIPSMQVKTVGQAVLDRLHEGKLTLHEAGRELHRAGWSNHVPDAKETLRMLNQYAQQVNPNDSRMKGVDQQALEAAIGAGVDVSLRDFSVALPPTDRRIAMGLASAALGSRSMLVLESVLRHNHYRQDPEKVRALWDLRTALKGGEIHLDQMVRTIKDECLPALKDGMDRETKQTADREQAPSEEAPRLHYSCTGNGISLWEEGEKSWTALISPERELTVRKGKEFHPSNAERIIKLCTNGNMLRQNGGSDVAYLVLEPTNGPSKIHVNPATGEVYPLSVETVDGKRYAVLGRQVLFDDEKVIDRLMDYNAEELIQRNGKLVLKQKNNEISNTQKSNDMKTTDENSKVNHEVAGQQAENQETRQLKDGVNLFKMNNGFWGINEVRNGERSATRRVSEADIKAYFEGLKGQPKEEVDRRRAALADKYLHAAPAKEEVRTARTEKHTLPPVSPEVRARLEDASVFKMQDGHNYGVRTKIDGEQHSAKLVSKQDIAAFFDGYKGMPKEQQEERKAQLAAVYFRNELNAPKEELGQGMKR